MGLVQAKFLPVKNRYLGKIWDHTYVVSDENDIWECNGSSSGGEDDAYGYGDLRTSRCIGNNNTGIVYGLTGVCHQMSNRVLASVGVELTSVIRGYFLSVSLFGTHGIDEHEWQERKFTCGLEDSGAPIDSLTNVLLNKRSEVLATSPVDVLMYNPFATYLRHKTGRKQFDSICAHSKNWKGQFLSDAIDYSRNSITAAEYVTKVNDGADRYVHKIAKSVSYSQVSKLLAQPISRSSKVILLEDSDLKN